MSIQELDPHSNWDSEVKYSLVYQKLQTSHRIWMSLQDQVTTGSANTYQKLLSL